MSRTRHKTLSEHTPDLTFVVVDDDVIDSFLVSPDYFFDVHILNEPNLHLNDIDDMLCWML